MKNKTAVEIVLRGRMSDQKVVELRRRNEERVKAVIAALGNRWVAHPQSRFRLRERHA